MRGATEWDEGDDTIPAARRVYLKLAKIRRENRKLLESVQKGGRKRKHSSSHSKFHGDIMRDDICALAFSKDGVMHATVLVKFYRRYRMGPKGNYGGTEAMGEMGPCALQKLTAFSQTECHSML